MTTESLPLVCAKELDVGVVVVAYNSERVIGGLLETLEFGLAGVDAEVVVVDNKSDDRTVDLARAAVPDVIESPRNDGYAAAINRGIRHFPGARSILVLNADVSLTGGSVAELFAELSDPAVGVVAPKMYISTDPLALEPSQRRDPALMSTWATALLGGRLAKRWPATFEAVSDPERYEVRCDVDWAVGAALLISRQCLDLVGPWDESYFLYAEETDYCQRVRDAGLAVRFTPRAVVVHPGGEGLVDSRLRAMMTVNRVRLYRRRHSIVAAWLFLAGTLLHELTRALGGRSQAWRPAAALILPALRPPELGVKSLMPR
jgi:GT2 family glycosyltransferase